MWHVRISSLTPVPIQEEEFCWYRYLNNKKICCGYELKWFWSGSNSHYRYQTKIWIFFFKNFRISTMNLYWNLTILTRKQCWPVYADNVSLSFLCRATRREVLSSSLVPAAGAPSPHTTYSTRSDHSFFVPLFSYSFNFFDYTLISRHWYIQYYGKEPLRSPSFSAYFIY